MNTLTKMLLLVGCGTMLAPALAEEPIPAHPDGLSFPPLEYKLPPAAQFREVLPNGVVVFITEDRLLPWCEIAVAVRAGGAFDPAGKAGLASLVGEQLRDGGTKNLTPEELDEKVDFLAARLNSSAGDTAGTAGISLLAKDIDEGLGLLFEMLRYPRFDEQRLRQAVDRRKQNVKRRNDSTSSIESIEWGFLMNGEEHYSNRYSSSASLDSITREDLQAFHQKYYHPANMIVAVAGDFDRSVMLEKLANALGDWPAGDAAPKVLPAPDHTPAPGITVVEKADVNQGRVALGHKSVMRGCPDEFALRIMNGVLGGTGFKSRLVQKVRSQEGLAYSVGSGYGFGVYYPDDFQCSFQTKSNSVPYAIRLTLDEIRRIQNEPIDAKDLDETISYFVESFPQRFESKMNLMQTYLFDEYTGRDSGYWQTYLDNLRKVTIEDVQRVARKYLRPDQVSILVVGNTNDVIAGGHDKAPELKLDSFGPIKRLQPRDPDTLKR